MARRNSRRARGLESRVDLRPCAADAPCPAVDVAARSLALAAPAAAQSGPLRGAPAAEEALAEAQALSDGRGVRTGRELSVALAQLAAQRDELSRRTGRRLTSCSPAPWTHDTAQTGGPYSTSARVLRNCSEHFCVHWVDSTEDAPPLTDANSCRHPDYVDAVRTAIEQSYAVENGALGWQVPGVGWRPGRRHRPDGRLPRGQQQPEQRPVRLCGPRERERLELTGYLVLDDDYAADEFPSYGGNYAKPVQVTTAHEYNHVLQFAYDVFEDPWMFESTATWAEDKVFPLADDWHNTWAAGRIPPRSRSRPTRRSQSTARRSGTTTWSSATAPT